MLIPDPFIVRSERNLTAGEFAAYRKEALKREEYTVRNPGLLCQWVALIFAIILLHVL